jgi:hypothetical protein
MDSRESVDLLDIPVTIRAFSSIVSFPTNARAFSSAPSHPPAPVIFAERKISKNDDCFHISDDSREGYTGGLVLY